MTKHRLIFSALLAGSAFALPAATMQASAQLFRAESDIDAASVLSPQLGAWPKLIASEDPELCGRYLNALKTSFKEPDYYVTAKTWESRRLFDINPYRDQSLRGAKPLRHSVSERSIGPSFALVRTDVDQDGADEGLMFSWFSHSWRG